MEQRYKVLASGVDSLTLTIDIHWKDGDFFKYLDENRELAAQIEKDCPIKLSKEQEIYALIKPYGRKGHRWIIENGDFQLSIGNWLTPISRPSIIANIRSETLWRIGAYAVVDLLIEILSDAGADKIKIKPSRVDLCVDMTFPEDQWNVSLLPLKVTRSRFAAPYFENTTMTGISIGKGNMAARLYDKQLEIKRKSKKYWMYDIWEIDLATAHEIKIIRIEGQFRRQAIKELGLDTIDELLQHLDNLWGYFSKDWLKFQDSPGEHHNKRTTLDWWRIVQNSFLGVQDPKPLIRCKTLAPTEKGLFNMAYGTLTSMLACEDESNNVPLNRQARVNHLLYKFDKCADEYGKTDFELETDLVAKRAKIYRTKNKMHKAHIHRKILGFPSNIDPKSFSDNGGN